jgi:hypothetical protein
MQSAVHDHLKAASAFTSSSRALSEALSEAALAEGAQRESAVSSVYYDAGPNHSNNDNSGSSGTGVHLEARDVLTQARKAAAQQCEVDAVQETRLREKLLQPLLGEIAYAKQLVRELTALGTLVNKHQKAVLAFDKAQTSPEAVAEALDDAGSPAVSSPLREKALVLQRDANIQVCERMYACMGAFVVLHGWASSYSKNVILYQLIAVCSLFIFGGVSSSCCTRL